MVTSSSHHHHITTGIQVALELSEETHPSMLIITVRRKIKDVSNYCLFNYSMHVHVVIK